MKLEFQPSAGSKTKAHHSFAQACFQPAVTRPSGLLLLSCCHAAQRPASHFLLPAGLLVALLERQVTCSFWLASFSFLLLVFFLPRARHWSLHFTHAACMFQHVNDCRHAIAASLTPACFSSRPWPPATRLLPLCVTAPAC